MRNSLITGIGRYMFPMPSFVWRRQVSRGAANLKNSLGFMSPDHHRVRYFVVRELPRKAAPLTPAYISRELDLPLPALNSILEELEKHLTFLFRNPEGNVSWAYPVTADATPHKVAFSTGEKIYAA